MLTKIHVVYIFIVGLVGNFIENLQLYVYVLRYSDVQKLSLKKNGGINLYPHKDDNDS